MSILHFILTILSVLFNLCLGVMLVFIANDIKKKKNSKCPKCGFDVKEEFKYCRNCGSELHVGYNETGMLILFILGFLIIFSCILFLIIYLCIFGFLYTFL